MGAALATAEGATAAAAAHVAEPLAHAARGRLAAALPSPSAGGLTSHPSPSPGGSASLSGGSKSTSGGGGGRCVFPFFFCSLPAARAVLLDFFAADGFGGVVFSAAEARPVSCIASPPPIMRI